MNRIITALFLAFVLAGCTNFDPPKAPIETAEGAVLSLRVWVEDARWWYKQCAPESVFEDVETLLSRVEGHLDDAEKLYKSGSLVDALLAVASAQSTVSDTEKKLNSIRSRCVE